MYKLKLSCSVNIIREGFEKKLEEMKQNGFDALDVDLCVSWRERDVEVEALKHLRERLETVKSYNIPINGVHISFGHYWDFSSADQEKRELALKNFYEICPLIDEYATKCYIIHGSYEPIAAEDRQKQTEALRDSLVQLTAHTKTPIAVESLPRTCLFNTAKEGIGIIDGIDNVYACVDVNHFLQEKSEDAVLELGNRIITTHISDHDYVDERHWIPGEGKIDWNKLIGALEAVGYNGAFNYEVNAEPAILKANYDKLFAEYNASEE